MSDARVIKMIIEVVAGQWEYMGVVESLRELLEGCSGDFSQPFFFFFVTSMFSVETQPTGSKNLHHQLRFL